GREGVAERSGTRTNLCQSAIQPSGGICGEPERRGEGSRATAQGDRTRSELCSSPPVVGQSAAARRQGARGGDGATGGNATRSARRRRPLPTWLGVDARGAQRRSSRGGAEGARPGI